MHPVHVVMKDGREFDSPIWKWRPKQGAFTLVGVDGWLFLRDVASAKGHDRIRMPRDGECTEQDYDLIEHALTDLEPWDGVTAVTPDEGER